MILDAITSSPFNVFVTIVIGISLAYLYYRKPSSSSSSSSSATSSAFFSSRTQSQRGLNRLHSTIGAASGGGFIDEDLQRTIAQIERQERDMIRQEQDEAYQQSLKADREKQLKRAEELKRKEAEEKEKQEKIVRQEELHNRLIKLKSEISDKLLSEPYHDHKDIVKLVFKLPDGTRFKRNFTKDAKVKYLYWYVFSLNNAPLQFKMTTNFPKRDLPGRPPIPEDFVETNPPTESSSNHEPNCEQTLEEANLTETQIIFVYDLEA